MFQAKIPQERKHDIAKDSSTGQIEGDKQNTTFEVDEEKLVKWRHSQDRQRHKTDYKNQIAKEHLIYMINKVAKILLSFYIEIKIFSIKEKKSYKKQTKS